MWLVVVKNGMEWRRSGDVIVSGTDHEPPGSLAWAPPPQA